MNSISQTNTKMKKTIITILIFILVAGNVLAGWNQLSHTILANGQTLVSSEDENAQQLIQVMGLMSSAFSGNHAATLVFLLSQSDEENAQKYQVFGQMLSALQTPDKTTTETQDTNTDGQVVREITGKAAAEPKECKANIFLNLEESGNIWQTTNINSIHPRLSEESKSNLVDVIGEVGFDLPKTDGQVLIDELTNCGFFESITNMEVLEATEGTDKIILKLGPNTNKKAGLEKKSQAVVLIGSEKYIFKNMNQGTVLTFHLLKEKESITEIVLEEAKIVVLQTSEYKFPNVDSEILVPTGTYIEYKEGKAYYTIPQSVEEGPSYNILANGQIIPITFFPGSRLTIEGNTVTGKFGFKRVGEYNWINDEVTQQAIDFQVSGSVTFTDGENFIVNEDTTLSENNQVVLKTNSGKVKFNLDENRMYQKELIKNIDRIQIHERIAKIIEGEPIYQKYCDSQGSTQKLTGGAVLEAGEEAYCPVSVNNYNTMESKPKIILYYTKEDLITSGKDKGKYSYYWFDAGTCYFYGIRVAAGISESQAPRGSAVSNKIFKLVDTCESIVEKNKVKPVKKYTHPSAGTLTKITAEGAAHLYSMFKNPSSYFEKTLGSNAFKGFEFDVGTEEFSKDTSNTPLITYSDGASITVQECCIIQDSTMHYVSNNYGYTCREAAKGIARDCSKGSGQSWTTKTQGGERVQNSNTGEWDIAPKGQHVVCCKDYYKFYN